MNDVVPPVLYKYLDVGGAIHTLERCSVKFSPPNKFNDPFEFMPGGYSGDTPEVRLRIVNKILEKNPERINDYNAITGFSYSLDDWKTFFSMNTEKRDEIFLKLQNRNWKDFVKLTSEKVVCLSLSQCRDNLLMWAHYAEMHKGIVIGFKIEFFSHLHKVTYSTKRVIIPFSITVSQTQQKKIAVAMMTTKSEDWRYEQEWRSILHVKELKYYNGLYLQDFPPEAIDSIILGVNIDESLKKEILASILKFPNCKLYQAKLHQSEFALDIVPL